MSIVLFCNVVDVFFGMFVECIVDVVFEDFFGLYVKCLFLQVVVVEQFEIMIDVVVLECWVGCYWSLELVVIYMIEFDVEGLFLCIGLCLVQCFDFYVDGIFVLLDSMWVCVCFVSDGCVESFIFDVGCVWNLVFFCVSKE